MLVTNVATWTGRAKLLYFTNFALNKLVGPQQAVRNDPTNEHKHEHEQEHEHGRPYYGDEDEGDDDAAEAEAAAILRDLVVTYSCILFLKATFHI